MVVALTLVAPVAPKPAEVVQITQTPYVELRPAVVLPVTPVPSFDKETLEPLKQVQAAKKADEIYRAEVKRKADCVAGGGYLELWGGWPTCVQTPLSAPPVQSVPQPAKVIPTASVSVRRPYIGGPSGYPYGQCTYLVKLRRPDVGGYNGNAAGWLSVMIGQGYSHGSVPRADSIAWTPTGGYGHVAYVQSINADGSANIEEMNYGGVGVLHYRTVQPSEFATYIY